MTIHPRDTHQPLGGAEKVQAPSEEERLTREQDGAERRRERRVSTLRVLALLAILAGGAAYWAYTQGLL